MKEKISNSGFELIYVVDDEPDILDLILINLKKAGYKAKGFENGSDLFKLLKNSKPDLIILDVMLPCMDGIEICKALKKDKYNSQIPVMFLTAKTEELDKVVGLEIGAEDYVTKPFSIGEFLARVRVILRRGKDDHISKEISIAKIITINTEKYQVYINGREVKLTFTEYKILLQLAERIGWVFSRDQILDNLDTVGKGVIDRTVDVHIRNLREKLGDAAKLIKNVRGIGYKIDVNQ